MFEERWDDRVAVGRRANFELHVAQHAHTKKIKRGRIHETSGADAGERGGDWSPQHL